VNGKEEGVLLKEEWEGAGRRNAGREMREEGEGGRKNRGRSLLYQATNKKSFLHLCVLVSIVAHGHRVR